jgi:hypothetical protein
MVEGRKSIRLIALCWIVKVIVHIIFYFDDLIEYFQRLLLFSNYHNMSNALYKGVITIRLQNLKKKIALCRWCMHRWCCFVWAKCLWNVSFYFCFYFCHNAWWMISHTHRDLNVPESSTHTALLFFTNVHAIRWINVPMFSITIRLPVSLWEMIFSGST